MTGDVFSPAETSQLMPLQMAARPSIRSQVTDALRAAVMTGELVAGTIYSAPALARQFGVSATPIREAMMELERDGMVEALRNSGFRVRALTDRELDEMAELRILIEAPAMASIAARCDGDIAEAVEALRPLAAQLDRLALDTNMIDYLRVDLQFHSKFLSLYGNVTLVATVVGLRRRSRLYGLEALARANGLAASTAEHTQMIELALARNADGLRALTEKHIAHVRTDWAGPAQEPQPAS